MNVGAVWLAVSCRGAPVAIRFEQLPQGIDDRNCRRRRGAFGRRQYEILGKLRTSLPNQPHSCSFKADCLLDAGIITEGDKEWVEARVLSVLAGDDHPFAPNLTARTLDLDVPEDQR
jgi:hypothetical protein